MSKTKVNVISLGCSKNLIDAERLMRMLDDAGCVAGFECPVDWGADLVVINTCGFIGDAKEESIDTILNWIKAKNEGFVKEVCVMGCLSERYRKELPIEIEEVDLWFGKYDWTGIVSHIMAKHPASARYDRIITTPRHHAYLKIAEGCNRFCAFCAIPLITGRFHSRPIEEIEGEVKLMVSRGVKEFNIIAQELTSYGLDLYGHRCLADLIRRLAKIEGVEWLRLHYAYPAEFPLELLDVMANEPKVCKYLDIALQHISDKVLMGMRRHITGKETRALLEKIRARVPGIHIRTTLMVGYPGETEKEFEELMEFVREQRFERMGAFAYCEEDDTIAAKTFVDEVPEEVKQSRLDRLMALQEEISTELQQSKVGQHLKVIIDREEEDYYVGRSQYDSPEVDPEVLIKKTQQLTKGEFCNVVITEAMPFELIGEPLL